MDDNELTELAKLKEGLDMMSAMLKNITIMFQERFDELEKRAARFEEDMARMNQEKLPPIGHFSFKSEGTMGLRLSTRHLEIGGELLMRSPFE